MNIADYRISLSILTHGRHGQTLIYSSPTAGRLHMQMYYTVYDYIKCKLHVCMCLITDLWWGCQTNVDLDRQMVFGLWSEHHAWLSVALTHPLWSGFLVSSGRTAGTHLQLFARETQSCRNKPELGRQVCVIHNNNSCGNQYAWFSFILGLFWCSWC